MRGKADARRGFFVASGITPACAGKSWLTSRGSSAAQDHPRLCGEKDYLFELNKGFMGSPPLVRGKDLKSQRIPTIPSVQSAHFIQFFKHSKCQVTIRKRTMRCGNVHSKVGCECRQFIIRNRVKSSFCQLKRIGIWVFEFGQMTFAAGSLDKRIVKCGVMANHAPVGCKRKKSAHSLIQRLSLLLQHIVVNARQTSNGIGNRLPRTNQR